MQKKICLAIVLLSVLALGFVLFRAGGERSTPGVRAASLETTFTSPFNISNSAPDGTQLPRAVLGPDGYLHVSFMESDGSKYGPAYVKGKDTTWPAWEWAGPHNNPGYTKPALALDSTGTVHMVWAGGGGSPYDIYYAAKPAGGSWSSPVNISNESDNTVFPRIAVDANGRIWVTWQASTSTNTRIYARSKPAGGSWEGVMTVSTSAAENQNPTIAVDGNNVPHIVWRNSDAGTNWEIYYSKWTGSAWTAPINISGTSTPSHYAYIAVGPNDNLYVAWEDEISAYQTMVRRWDGTQWLAAKRVSYSTQALWPAIAVDGCNVYVTWMDYRDSPKPEIYFTYSTDCAATFSAEENVSRNATQSWFPEIVAASGGVSHIFWEDLAPGQLDIFYSKATVQVGPTPVPTTVVPTTAVPTSTPTPTATPTPDPRPHGYVEVEAQEPLGDETYTRLLTTTLYFSATSDIGRPVTQMRFGNYADFHDHPTWESFAPALANWRLLDSADLCEDKYVFAQYQDDQGNISNVYSDHIRYDGYLTASMVLNDGKAYTNRTMVMINSQDLDGNNPDPQENCSGLEAMSVWEEGMTQTNWLDFYPRFWFLLSPGSSTTRTVYVAYRDRAHNTGVFSDSIAFDVTPPYSGTPPLLNNGVPTTTRILVPIGGLGAQDDESGVANVWLANRAGGPWQVRPIETCMEEPWNLAFGGPPIQYPDLHSVYVVYEDDSGYENYAGNLSESLSSTISIAGISNIFLPLVVDAFGGGQFQVGPQFPQAGLLLLADPPQAPPGREVRIYLFARREHGSALAGAMQVALPEGLRVVKAQSAYGEIVQVSDHLVTSLERASPRQSPFLLIRAVVEDGAAADLQVRGRIEWSNGLSAEAEPLRFAAR